MGNLWSSDDCPPTVTPPKITSALPVAPTVASSQQQPASDFIAHLNATGSTGSSIMEARAGKRKRSYKPIYPGSHKRKRISSQPLKSGTGKLIRNAAKPHALRNANAIPFPVADAVEYADDIEAREEKEREESDEEYQRILANAPVAPVLPAGGAGPAVAPRTFKVKTGSVKPGVHTKESAAKLDERAKQNADWAEALGGGEDDWET